MVLTAAKSRILDEVEPSTPQSFFDVSIPCLIFLISLIRSSRAIIPALSFEMVLSIIDLNSTFTEALSVDMSMYLNRTRKYLTYRHFDFVSVESNYEFLLQEAF